MDNKKRKVYLDVLKVIACYAVILQHNTDLSLDMQTGWEIQYLFYYIGRFAVPIFVMSSGVLLLDEKREIKIKSIFIKYIPRIFLPLIGILYVMQITDAVLTKQFSWKIIYRPLVCALTNNVSVPYWYIYMMIGIYLMLPFVRKMVHACSKREIELFILMFLVARTLLPFADAALSVNYFNNVTSALMLNLFGGYVAMMILGYYLDKYEDCLKAKHLIIVDLLCVIVPLLYVYYFATDKYTVGMIFADIFSVNMVLHACIMFLVAKKCCKNLSEKMQSIVSSISKHTFGIYVLHVYILQMFNVWKVTEFKWGVLKPPICALLNFGICIVLTMTLKKIFVWLRRIKHEKL